MFLANENFPKPSITVLRQNGFHVKSIQEEMPGIADEEVINTALNLNLIILTFDRDDGELIFKFSVNNPPSVVYFRAKGSDPLFASRLLLDLLSNPGISLRNAFTAIELNNIRQRFYKK